MPTTDPTPIAPARRYAMVRLGAGDYLLPDNDGRTLWRIRSYEEYGDAVYRDPDGMPHPITGRFWAVCEYVGRRPVTAMDADELDDCLNDYERWPQVDGGYETRRDAVAGALRTTYRGKGKVGR